MSLLTLKDRKQIWSIPNLLSFFRILLIPVMVTLYVKGRTIAALVVFGVSALSDIVDGQIARRCNMVTDLGKMLDPLADKLTQGAALVCVARTHPQLFFLLGFMAMKELTRPHREKDRPRVQRQVVRKALHRGDHRFAHGHVHLSPAARMGGEQPFDPLLRDDAGIPGPVCQALYGIRRDR